MNAQQNQETITTLILRPDEFNALHALFEKLNVDKLDDLGISSDDVGILDRIKSELPKSVVNF